MRLLFFFFASDNKQKKDYKYNLQTINFQSFTIYLFIYLVIYSEILTFKIWKFK